jgi:hypothetical protein
MIIYRAYLDYGPYNGTSEVGYFESIAGAHRAIKQDAEDCKFKLEEPVKQPWGTVYRVLYWDGYEYVLQTINVKP